MDFPLNLESRGHRVPCVWPSAKVQACYPDLTERKMEVK